MFWKLLFFVIIVLLAVYSIRSVLRQILYLSDAIAATPEQCSKEFREYSEKSNILHRQNSITDERIKMP